MINNANVLSMGEKIVSYDMGAEMAEKWLKGKCLEGLYGINMSQPDWNDMEKVYQNTLDKRIEIIGMPTPEVCRATEAGRNLRGRVHCGVSIAA